MKILVIDDERSQREILADILSDAGFEVSLAANGEAGSEMICQEDFPLVLTDLKMPGKSGIDVLKEALDYNPDTQVILMTAFGTIPNAVNAIKTGAYDYLTKPFHKEDLLQVLNRAAEKASLLLENRRLQSEIDERYSYGNIIGNSQEMGQVFRLIERVKDLDATVLITGESGTGKELAARAIHFNSRRKKGPFVALNCGAIPATLIESELFGHEKGAFTGANRSNAGSFEQANGGTFFLDEIGVTPLSMQVKLLRVLQEKRVQRVGGSKSIELDVRIIAATNEDLEAKVSTGDFRPDLFHRLNVFTINLPPLRERPKDIPVLAKHFLGKCASRYGKPAPLLSPEALHKLEDYDFPGNVRELENIIEKTVILADDEIISPENLMLTVKMPASAETAEAENSLPETERNMIISALKKNKGSIKNAAKSLGLTYKTLQYRMKKFGLDKKDFK